MLRRSGLLLAFATVLLQIAVFLQPLLPEQYQIAPVCEHITHSLLHPDGDESDPVHQTSFIHHYLHLDQSAQNSDHHDHQHDINHQCQYCVVYGNLVLPPEFGISEVFVRLQVRLIAYSKIFQHVYFALQRLYLIPQGRAPPFSFA